MLEPLLASLDYVGHFLIHAKDICANGFILYPCKWLVPKIMDLLAHKWGINPHALANETQHLIGNQWYDVDFHPWESNLKLIITLP